MQLKLHRNIRSVESPLQDLVLCLLNSVLKVPLILMGKVSDPQWTKTSMAKRYESRRISLDGIL